MTTVEATQGMAAPEILTDPDPLFLELATTPLYAQLVGEVGDPYTPVEGAGTSDKVRTEFGEWCKQELTAYTAWLGDWPNDSDAEEKGEQDARPSA